MCIIVAKPKDVSPPSKATLRTCWDKNPYGAGLMWCDGSVVRYSKGYMKFKTFYKAVQKLDSKHPWCLHFRISTHGGINQACTHPFPYTTDIEAMKVLEGEVPVAVMHNGIFPLDGGKDYSDTMEWIQLMAAMGINPCADGGENEQINKLIELAAVDQRVVFMDKDNVLLYGEWRKHEECYYSNDGYKTYFPERWNYVEGFNKSMVVSTPTTTKHYKPYQCDICEEVASKENNVHYYEELLMHLCEDCAEGYGRLHGIEEEEDMKYDYAAM